MANSSDLIIFAEPDHGQSRDSLMQGAGLQTASVSSSPALNALLDDVWNTGLVVLDMRIADADILQRLQSPDAPPALFLAPRDDWQLDAISLAPNVVDYHDLPVTPQRLREIILDQFPAAAPAGVADFSDRDSARLNALGRDVERIARALSDIASEADAETASNSVTAPVVRSIIKRRRDRERYFPAELFGDPAWDMMLDLIAAELEGRSVSVSSLCIAAAVPTTTALRWIRNLCDARVFERNIDPEDARRGIISLSPTTTELMLAYLASVRAAAVV